MKTPVRPVRIKDELWKKAEAIAKDLAEETGFEVTASDVVRRGLKEYVERHNAAKRQRRAAVKSE